MDIGKKIKRLRLEKEWSQEELGIKMGVKKQQISLYENGKNTPPLDKLHKLCEVFGIEMNDLSRNGGQGQATEFEILQKENAELRKELSELKDKLINILLNPKK